MSRRTTFTAYITKYALSTGIYSAEVEDCFDIDLNMVREVNRALSAHHKGDWWRTPEEAIARAESMRAKKIASLKKQIGKLGNMKFEVKP